ncbi:MAG: DUF3048 domain-containing protein, partial [bacterium]
SGLPGGAGKPVLAVKIDNTASAQPHTGLAAADVVYVQEVEGQLTRLLAMFSTTLPKEVAPVRSARISDIDILANYGRVAFAYSGASERTRRLLASADYVNVSEEAGELGWSTQPWRTVGWNNHVIDTAAIMARATDAAPARDIGFVFSEEPPPGGQLVEELTAAYGSSTVSFRWDAQAGGYRILMDGKPEESTDDSVPLAATVVLQEVVQKDSGLGDRYGGITPEIETVGQGTALVLRDGRMWTVTWDRPTADAVTRFQQADGTPMPFAIGQQWIVLLDKKNTPTIK